MIILLFAVFSLDVDVELLMIDFCVVEDIDWLVELTFLSCSRSFLRKRYCFLLAINRRLNYIGSYVPHLLCVGICAI